MLEKVTKKMFEKMTKKTALFYFGILPGLFVQFVGCYLYFVAFPESNVSYYVSYYVYGGTKAFLVLWPLLWFLICRKCFKWNGERSLNGSLAYGIFSGGFAAMLLVLFYSVFSKYFDGFGVSINEKLIELKLVDLYFWAAISISVLHSLLEEFYWRFFIFRGLLVRFKWKWAAGISSAGFALHHYVVLSEFVPLWLALVFGTVVGAAGYVWCVMYYDSKSLLGPWVSHMIVDLTIFWIGFQIIGW